jgi:hypothetical protein
VAEAVAAAEGAAAAAEAAADEPAQRARSEPGIGTRTEEEDAMTRSIEPRAFVAAAAAALLAFGLVAAPRAARAETPGDPGTAGAAAAAAPAQRRFASPKEAADAFVAALRSTEEGALVAIFGPGIDRFEPTDKVAARVDRERLADAAAETLELREDAPDQVTLVIGSQVWPFPIPLVAEEGSWRFDTEAGYDELLNRIVGSHELAAIDLLRSYVDAQAEYASQDRDGDQVLEYAQRILSSTGTHDGLYWPSEPGEDESPFGPFVAEAGAYAKGGQVGDPYRGYYFRVLKRQGAGVPGGAYDYVINGNMIGGFALLAWPADYGRSGVMTFAVNQQGRVYQKDLGDGTKQTVETLLTYAPDATWSEVEAAETE